MRRVDRERCQHRKDAGFEFGGEEGAIRLVEVIDGGDRDAMLFESRRNPTAEQGRAALEQAASPLMNSTQLLAGGHAIRGGLRQRRVHLLLQAGDADLEELVDGFAQDGKEADPLQQRQRDVLGHRQHPIDEIQLRELTVEVARRGSRRLDFWWRCGRDLVCQ